MNPILFSSNETHKPLDKTFFIERLNFVPGIKLSNDLISVSQIALTSFSFKVNIIVDVFSLVLTSLT